MELMDCPKLAVPLDVMQHVVRVESSNNPYAIGVVGGRLQRQPANLSEALATARMLERRGFNFSLGLAQVNRYNLGAYGLDSYEKAFDVCPNLQAGSRILAECLQRSGNDWGKAFSCYYSGNFVTGFRHGYVQKIFASMGRRPLSSSDAPAEAIAVVERANRRTAAVTRYPVHSSLSPLQRRIAGAAPAASDAGAVTSGNAAHEQLRADAAVSVTPSPAQAPSTAGAVAVLDASGGPPALVSVSHSAGDGSSTAAAIPDAAFVF
jgi:type IV secretion system protein VirB1